jgi:hypothetical protein
MLPVMNVNSISHLNGFVVTGQLSCAWAMIVRYILIKFTFICKWLSIQIHFFGTFLD